MRIGKLKYVLAVGTALAVAGAALAEQAAPAADATAAAAEHKFEKAQEYYAQCKNVSADDFQKIVPQLKAFTDSEVMAQTMADPVAFAKLAEVVSDPRTLHVMMSCATEPVMWDTWVRGMNDPAKMMRSAMVFANPNIYMNWMNASMNPAFYTPVMKMANPGYYTAWMTAMSNPAFFQPFLVMADPNWYTPRAQWAMNPGSYSPFFNWIGMMGGTQQTAAFNPFAWFGNFAAPQQAAPAQAPKAAG